MIDHLWQSTLFAAGVAVLVWALRRNRASVRHWLWFAASVKFLLPFAILSSLGQRVEPVAPAVAANVAKVVERAAEPLPYVVSFSAPAPPTDWTSWIVVLWACGAVVVVVMRMRAWWRVRALLRASRGIDLGLPIETRVAPGLLEPGVAGIWRPVLLLPEGILEVLSPRQFDAIVEHEMEHVRRRDNLTSLLHMLVEAAFWFHPLVWWIGSRLVEERERACDEAVIAAGNDPADYSEAIVSLCRRYVESPLACVAGVTGGDLKVRIEAIFRHDVFGLTWARKLLLVSAALIAAMLPFVAGIVSAQDKSFQVASIRLADPRASVQGNAANLPVLSNGRLRFSTTTDFLIQRALRLPGGILGRRREERFHLVGGPDWTTKATYTIQATLPAGTPEYSLEQWLGEGAAPEIDAMLASLLRDRFALRFHRETREMPVFTLTVATGGHKMKPTRGKMVEAPGGRRLMRMFMFDLFRTEDGRRMLRLGVVNRSMPQVAQSLFGWLDRPVIDRTGLSGAFDFHVDYPAAADGIGADYTGPELFTALREQAGLRLEATRAPIEVVVIDSIERPSEN